MKTYSRLNAPALTQQLESAGVLTEVKQEIAIPQPVPPGLLICQYGGVVESTVFDLTCGGTGLILYLHVAVDLPALNILGWRLDFPWEDPQFHWLTDPAEYTSTGIYKIPGCVGLEYSRNEVINHRHIVRRGQSLDGPLLGYGFESIPDSYRHGAMIEAGLVLIDEMQREFSTPVQLWADRSARINRQQKKKPTKASLFDKPDFINSKISVK